MQEIECKINLIMFNPHAGTQFTASDMQQVEAFRAIIMQVLPCNPLLLHFSPFFVSLQPCMCPAYNDNGLFWKDYMHPNAAPSGPSWQQSVLDFAHEVDNL